tara:strand:+ start:484 stop:840 length:357 start_codon:yes stop_codon:yes gene_type:complete
MATPSYSAAEKLKYGLPVQKTIDAAVANTEGAPIYVEPYRFHSYHVSGNSLASGTFNIYGSNGTEDSDYKLIASYGVAPGGTNARGLMYSDDWYFKYAKATISNYSAGEFTILERHGP